MIIGIEGVSCTGKTTLAAELARVLGDPLVVGCYYHCAPDPSWLPPPTVDTGEAQLANLRTLLRIESLRVQRVLTGLTEGRDIILDRTVDTLLAHTHAIGRLNGFDIDERARLLVQQSQRATPDLTLLLHASPQTLAARAALRVNMPFIYYAPDFTRHFNRHFTQALAPTVVPISSEADLAATKDAALTAIALHRTTLASGLTGSDVA